MPSIKYFGASVIGFLVVATLIVGGIRGDFKKSTAGKPKFKEKKPVKKIEIVEKVNYKNGKNPKG